MSSYNSTQKAIKEGSMKKSKEFTELYYSALVEYFKKYKIAIAEGGAVPDFPSYLIDHDMWALLFKTTPPRVHYLRPLLLVWPPLINRSQFGIGEFEVIPKSTVIRDDGKGCGPRVRMKIGQTVWYPTVYLLEYLEDKKRMKIIYSDRFGLK